MTGPLPASLAAQPTLDQWVRVDADGTVTVRTGKVELGQGILTALAQIAADELDVQFERLRIVAADTASGPDEGLTAGSMSVEQSGAALRQVCAEVRAAFLESAARALGSPAGTLAVRDGRFVGPDGSSLGYGDLAADTSLDRPAAGAVAPKPAAARTVAGISVPRLDLPDKVFGRPRFVTDLRPEGMLHGRVVRPPGPGEWSSTPDAVALPDGVSLVALDGLVGVLADTEYAADAAVTRLADTFHGQPAELPDDVAHFVRTAPSDSVVIDRLDGPAKPVRTHSATYTRPYLAHAALGPSCAVAHWHDDVLELWTHSQGIFGLRSELAETFGLATGQVVVRHVEGPGSYGHNGADDVAYDAALLALASPGRPVRVRWSRQDEFRWEPYGPPAVVELTAGLAEDGTVATWRHEVWSGGHSNRPGAGKGGRLLGAAETASPPVAGDPGTPTGGIGRNAVPSYPFPAHEVVGHRLLVAPLRTSSLRSLGAMVNVFAAESFLDELADLAGADPLEYRLAHLTDPRSRAVVEAAARLAGWGGTLPDGHGLGVGFARYKNTGAYCAVVAEVAAAHDVRVRRLSVAVDVGEAVNPDGLANQVEGGAVQATSWVLTEQVSFDRHRVTSDTWEAYPILRFTEVPAVDVEVVSRPDEPAMGAGEAAAGPTAAAIGNALARALGVRVRDLPFTRDRVVAALT